MSNVVKFRGVIIRETNVREADKILTILTKEYGKLTVGAKGARNTKSKYLVAQLFSYCDFVVYKGRGFYSLTQVDLIESFYTLRLDYERLEMAYEIVKKLDKWTIGEFLPAENETLLLLLLKSLVNLCKQDVDYQLVYLVFGFKFLQIIGFSPENDDSELSETARYALEYILRSDIGKVFNFTLEEDMVHELGGLYARLLPLLELM